MKHPHMLAALISILLFIYQALPVFLGKVKPLPKAFTIGSHVVYTILVLTGLMLFWQLYKVAGVQHWAVAKLVLLVMAVSATIKANRQKDNNISQAKAGMLIAAVAYVGIVVLAITKPSLLV